MASWEDDDPVQDPVQNPGQPDTLDLTEDDLALSMVGCVHLATLMLVVLSRSSVPEMMVTNCILVALQWYTLAVVYHDLVSCHSHKRVSA